MTTETVRMPAWAWYSLPAFGAMTASGAGAACRWCATAWTAAAEQRGFVPVVTMHEGCRDTLRVTAREAARAAVLAGDERVRPALRSRVVAERAEVAA